MREDNSKKYSFGGSSRIKINDNKTCSINTKKVNTKGKGVIVSLDDYNRVQVSSEPRGIIEELLKQDHYSGEEKHYLVALVGGKNRPLSAGPLDYMIDEDLEDDAHLLEAVEEEVHHHLSGSAADLEALSAESKKSLGDSAIDIEATILPDE